MKITSKSRITLSKGTYLQVEDYIKAWENEELYKYEFAYVDTTPIMHEFNTENWNSKDMYFSMLHLDGMVLRHTTDFEKKYPQKELTISRENSAIHITFLDGSETILYPYTILVVNKAEKGIDIDSVELLEQKEDENDSILTLRVPKTIKNMTDFIRFYSRNSVAEKTTAHEIKEGDTIIAVKVDFGKMKVTTKIVKSIERVPAVLYDICPINGNNSAYNYAIVDDLLVSIDRV